VNNGGTPRNLTPFKKGRPANPRGRPKEEWRNWLKIDRAAPRLREQLLRTALDRRVKIETCARVSMYLLDHANGRAKETVEVDNSGPKYPEMDIWMLEAMLELRKAALAKSKELPALPPQDRNGR
jgi:hypothetical protein